MQKYFSWILIFVRFMRFTYLNHIFKNILPWKFVISVWYLLIWDQMSEIDSLKKKIKSLTKEKEDVEKLERDTKEQLTEKN